MNVIQSIVLVLLVVATAVGFALNVSAVWELANMYSDTHTQLTVPPIKEPNREVCAIPGASKAESKSVRGDITCQNEARPAECSEPAGSSGASAHETDPVLGPRSAMLVPRPGDRTLAAV